jgi:hypothetical protein
VNSIDDTLRNLNVAQTADLQLLVAGLNGSSADKTVVLGASPDTVAAGDTLICDYNKFTLMRWADGGKSAVQSIAPLGSIPSLTNREYMCLAYDSASKGIVAKVNPASGSEYSINIRD